MKHKKKDKMNKADMYQKKVDTYRKSTIGKVNKKNKMMSDK